jgi:hypothetical protein
MSTIKVNRLENTATTDGGINIDSSGNCGVGTSSPLALYRSLSIHGPANDEGGVLDLATANQSSRAYVFNDSNGLSLQTSTSHPILLKTNNSERLRIDSSGNVGIGRTSPAQNLDVASTNNIAYALDGWALAGKGDSSDILLGGILGSQFDTLKVYTSGSERLRIDSSGNVGIGQTSAAANLHVKSGANDGNAVLRVEGSTNNNLDFSFNSTGADINVTASDPLLFSIAGTERMRVDNFGRVGIGTSNFATNSGVGIKLNYATSTPSVDLVCDTGANNTFFHLYNINATNNGYRFYVIANGGIRNFSANNSNLCDEREKKNIVALDNKWDSVKAWDLKKFHYNDNSDTDDKLYGVIAQQVEEHCPEVITDWLKQKAEDAVLDEDGNVVTPAVPEILRKGVKEQQMMWMAIKALQEAQTRIETLETQNASLEARLTALEGGAS